MRKGIECIGTSFYTNTIIMVVILFALFSGCDTKPFRGFLVCKVYIPSHMQNEQIKTIIEAGVHVPIVRSRRHKPRYVPSEWLFYVANKDIVRTFNVDSLTYTRYKVGERIVMD